LGAWVRQQYDGTSNVHCQLSEKRYKRIYLSPFYFIASVKVGRRV
jgi:hypothetical protein